jgi:2-amino-4-hydroxy-6-hydroxymethyldihydropteridine diphosphokinase
MGAGKSEAFIAVGSNIRPADNVPAALARLMEVADVVAVSTFYRVRPFDRPAQPDYRNGVFRLLTDAAPADLQRRVLRGIEAEIGRERARDRHAARTIDLDLVLFDGVSMDEDGLVLPAPEILEWNFIAVPLAELAPDAVLPGSGRGLAEIATGLGRSGLTVDAPLTQTLKEMLADEHKPR